MALLSGSVSGGPNADDTATPTDRAVRTRWWLTGASAAQLAVALAGLAVSVKRRHPYEFLFLHGRPENVARDAIVGMGTPMSAPALMLAAQAAATVQLARGGTGRPELVLGGLGAAMVPGYLGEALVRRRLRRSDVDALETPLVALGLALAAVMAVVGLAGGGPRSGSVTPPGGLRRGRA
jgi:hypothetical protein